jgi:uncharacterized membrane protein YbaN (DUF454 family)
VTEPHAPTPLHRKRARNLAWGIFFFLLGVIGVLIPVMPQIPFFVMSLIFFSLVFPKVRRALRRWRQRHPKVNQAYLTWRHKTRQRRRKKMEKKRRAARHHGPRNYAGGSHR